MTDFLDLLKARMRPLRAYSIPMGWCEEHDARLCINGLCPTLCCRGQS